MKDKLKERSLLSVISYQLSVCVLSLFTVYCSLFTDYAAFALEAPSSASSQPAPMSKIGVILPLSGKYAAFGEQALKGVLLAAGVFKDGLELSNYNIEIIVKDTKDDPIASAKAVEELALSENVAGIIGPLLSITVTDAVSKAQELKTPIITLSQKEGLTGAGDYVFRNFLLPSEQAKAVADYAINKLNYKKFAILYPNSHYGIELANLFKEEVKKNKGEIAAEEQYKEGQTYFGKEITKLFKIKETEKKEGRRKIKIFETTVTADALYMPDYFDTIGLIAPHLAYYNIKDVKLLGSNGWNSPKLIELAGKYVEGAVFADGFFADSKKEAVLRFVNNFKSLYNMEPGIIEAQAYDAVKMMMEAVKKSQQPEVRSQREEVRANLTNLKDFPGATGNITFDSNREAVKNLFMLEVKNGKIVEVKD